MVRCRRLLWLAIVLLISTLELWAERQTGQPIDATVQMYGDEITASLLIADPAIEVYSVFGHCALRLQNSSCLTDNTYTFETSTDTDGIFHFFKGTALGGFVSMTTAYYLGTFEQAGRGISEYRLNLTPAERLKLWKAAEQEVQKGYDCPYRYMHAQCTSMCIHLLSRALDEPIHYEALPDGLSEASFRDVMLQASEDYPWSGFFWQFLMGVEGDETEPLTDKLTPQWLPAVLQKATIANTGRHLVTDSGQRLLDIEPGGKCCWWTAPIVVFALLLLAVTAVSISQRRRGWRVWHGITDALLLAAHTSVSLFLLFLVCCSRQDATGWNWYLLVFNPLPQLFWFMAPAHRKNLCRFCIGMVLLQTALTPVVPQLDMAHTLFALCFIPRLIIAGCLPSAGSRRN